MAGDIQKIGSGKGIIGAYKVLVEAYESAAEEVEKFTPPGKGPEYVKSFKKSMAQVYGLFVSPPPLTKKRDGRR